MDNNTDLYNIAKRCQWFVDICAFFESVSGSATLIRSLGTCDQVYTKLIKRETCRTHAALKNIVCLCYALFGPRQKFSTTVWVNLPPPWYFLTFFPNGWEFLVQILPAYYTFLSTLDYKFLFNCLQLLQSYAILSATTQRAFRRGGHFEHDGSPS